MTSPECHNPRVLKRAESVLAAGRKALDVGALGRGKESSIFQAIAGLWTKGSGHLAPIPTRQPYFFFTVSVGDLVASRPITLYSRVSVAPHGRKDKGFDSSVATDSVRSAERSGCDRTRRGR